MRSIGRTTVLALMLLAPVCSGMLQKPGGKPAPKPVATPPKPVVETPKLVPVVGTFEEAKKSAKERNVPLVLHLLLEAEEASDLYRTDVITNPALIKKSAECVVMIANNGTHPKQSIEEMVGGAKTKRDVCSVYPMFASCAQHQRPFDELHALFHDPSGQLRCPQTFVFLADGTISLQVNNGAPPDPADLVGAIGEAQTKSGPGLTQAQLDQVRKLLADARALMGSKSFAEAWRTWQSVLAITQRTVYGEEASRESAKALLGLQAELERITAALVPGTAVKAYQELKAHAKTLAGTPLEKDVLARIKKTEQDKSTQPEIAAWKLSVEADALLGEARDLYEQKDEKKGEKLVRKLLSKRFASTLAAETARKLWPEVAASVAGETKTPPK